MWPVHIETKDKKLKTMSGPTESRVLLVLPKKYKLKKLKSS
jgi:hypothetical protein